MSMRMQAVWMASVGYNEYNVDEDSSEDDASAKDNHIKDTARRSTCSVRLLVQHSK